jgi:hypothetical protein
MPNLPPVTEWGPGWWAGGQPLRNLPSLEWLNQWMTRRRKMGEAQEGGVETQYKMQGESQRKSELAAFAETQPTGLYGRAISGFEEPMQSYFSQRFSDIYNKYLAEVTANPGINFSGFLSKYDFYKDYMSQPYINRGGYQERTLAPPTRSYPY